MKKNEEEEGNHYDDSEYEYEYVDGYQDAKEPLSQDSGEKNLSQKLSQTNLLITFFFSRECSTSRSINLGPKRIV